MSQIICAGPSSGVRGVVVPQSWKQIQLSISAIKSIYQCHYFWTPVFLRHASFMIQTVIKPTIFKFCNFLVDPSAQNPSTASALLKILRKGMQYICSFKRLPYQIKLAEKTFPMYTNTTILCNIIWYHYILTVVTLVSGTLCKHRSNRLVVDLYSEKQLFRCFKMAINTTLLSKLSGPVTVYQNTFQP